MEWTENELEIECPCCGDLGAVADADGYFYDGQPLVCGCNGHVTCDAETAPDISVYDDCPCNIDREFPAAKVLE